MKHGYAVAYVHNGFHYVLYHDYRDARISRLGDELHGLADLGGVEPRHYLVEHQQFGPRREGSGHLEPFLVRERDIRHHLVAQIVQADEIENLVDGVTDPDEVALESALRQTERLGKLVTYLLDLSRLEAGAAALDVSEVRLAEFLTTVADAAGHVRPDKSLRFTVDVAPPSLTLHADEQRLHQVFANLAENAVRHSPRGGTIRFEAYVMPGGVVIDVVDEGPGIAAGDRERVFDRFARGNNPAQTGQIPTGGTGLGLSIVRWAVTLHGGTVEVADTPTGCTMRVTLPPRPTSVEPPRPPSPEGP